MSHLLQDIKFGLRLLWKQKGFALTTILTLAACIGANATIFSVVNAVLLRPLPFPEAERLVTTTRIPAPASSARATACPIISIGSATSRRSRNWRCIAIAG